MRKVESLQTYIEAGWQIWDRDVRIARTGEHPGYIQSALDIWDEFPSRFVLDLGGRVGIGALCDGRLIVLDPEHVMGVDHD